MAKIYNRAGFILLDFENNPYCQKFYATEFPKEALVINKLDFDGSTVQLVCGDVNVKLSTVVGKGIIIDVIDGEMFLENEPIFDKIRNLRMLS